MNKKIISTNILVALLVVSSVFSQTKATNVANNLPRIIALGGTSTALSGAIGTFNPASIVNDLNQFSIYYNNLHSMPGYEIKGFNLGIGLPMGKLAVVYEHEGVKLFEDRTGEIRGNLWENKQFGIGYGLKIRDNIKFGFGVGEYIQQISFDDTEKANRKLMFDFGMLWDSERWCLGIAAKSLLSSKEKSSFQEFGFGLRLGEAKKLAAYVETTVKKNEVWHNQILFNGGVEAWIRPNFALRVGLDSANMVTTGLGFKKGKTSIDYAYCVHSLGNTHYLGTSFHF